MTDLWKVKQYFPSSVWLKLSLAAPQHWRRFLQVTCVCFLLFYILHSLTTVFLFHVLMMTKQLKGDISLSSSYEQQTPACLHGESQCEPCLGLSNSLSFSAWLPPTTPRDIKMHPKRWLPVRATIPCQRPSSEEYVTAYANLLTYAHKLFMRCPVTEQSIHLLVTTEPKTHWHWTLAYLAGGHGWGVLFPFWGESIPRVYFRLIDRRWTEWVTGDFS